MGVPVFDIETVDWIIPVLVGFFDGKEYTEFTKISEEHDVVWSFLEALRKDYKGIKLYAHNATQFDNRIILDCLLRHNERPIVKANAQCLIWDDIIFMDSLALTGRGLNKLCAAFNVPQKLEWKHDETKNPWEMGPRLEEFSAYLKRDCMSLSQALEKFCMFTLENWNVTLSTNRYIQTLALLAVRILEKNYLKLEDVERNSGFNTVLEGATYGPRKEVYKLYGTNIFNYDINCSFTSCFDAPMPVGPLRRLKKEEFSIDRGTVIKAKIKVPTSLVIGPLPYRLNGKLCFPVGEFGGDCWWDAVELRNAVKNHGVEILEIITQLECTEVPVLKAFGNDLHELALSTENANLRRLVLGIGQRLAGKFGQKVSSTETKHISDMTLEDHIGAEPIDPHEVYFSCIIKKAKEPQYTRRALNMRIKAEARLRHTNYLIEASKKGNVYLCNTDSMYTDVEHPVSKEPGKLKLVDFAIRGYFINPGVYGVVTPQGLLKQKTAGYRDYQLTEEDFKKLLRGEELPCTFKRLGNLKEILAANELKMYERHMTAKIVADRTNRIRVGDHTEPIVLPESSVPAVFVNAFSKEKEKLEVKV